MKINIHEVTDQDTDLDFTQEEAWVKAAVARVDEEPVANDQPRTARVHFNLRKVDEVVVISGDIDTSVELLCSRCANAFRMKCRPSFSALFCQDPDMAGIAHLNEGRQPVGKNQGFARHAHEQEEPGSRDLDITYLSEDTVDLASLITEQLQLKIPFQPLCREDCKGICFQCGADFNQGRCACAKINEVHPFAALKMLQKNLSETQKPKTSRGVAPARK